MKQSRWPKSIHSQVEAILHAVRAVREKKRHSKQGIRSFGTWRVYRQEFHRFARYMSVRGCHDLRDTATVMFLIEEYLAELLSDYEQHRCSHQSMKRVLSALAKLVFARNSFIQFHEFGIEPLNCSEIFREASRKSKRTLARSSISKKNRAYPYVEALVRAISSPTHRIQARLQMEGGLRTEGVGAASNRVANPLTLKSMLGFCIDPVTGAMAGKIESKEKGGKLTEHYVSVDCYLELEKHIKAYGELKSNYDEYLADINTAARLTNQHSAGRGTHGLKFAFAQRRYTELIAADFSHEDALRQLSRELSHYRPRIALAYTRGGER